MSSTVTNVEALLSGSTALPRISGEPTFKDVALARHILNQNAISIQSYDGGEDHGYLGLVMTPIEYIMQVPGGSCTRPHSHCPTMDITDGASSVEASIILHEHAEQLRAYRLSNNVDKAYCKCILEAYYDKFLSSRADPIIRYTSEC
jgi:hypothetical protein